MAVIKTGDFTVAQPAGTVTPTTVRNTIETLYASVGFSPFASGLKSGNPCTVFALQFSGAGRGTVYQEFVCSIVNTTITIAQTLYTTYNAGSFTGTGQSPTQSFTILNTEVERRIFAYVKTDEWYCLATRSPATANQYLGVCSPATKPTWWNEDLFCHVFGFVFNGASELPSFRGIYRGIDPNFFNPFPNTTSANANNVTATIGDALTWNKNPSNQYDVFVQPMLRWTGFVNYGWVGRFSNDIGLTSDESLQPEQVLTLSETEVYEVLSVGGERAFVVRVV